MVSLVQMLCFELYMFLDQYLQTHQHTSVAAHLPLVPMCYAMLLCQLDFCCAATTLCAFHYIVCTLSIWLTQAMGGIKAVKLPVNGEQVTVAM